MEESLQKRYFVKTMENQKNTRYCQNHLTGYWAINPYTGKYYARCSQGFKFQEQCEIGKE